MDIQKEWDLFVAHLRTLGVVKISRNALGVITNLTREGNCSLGYNDIELMWETWQVAQAVPEGFVLVPKAESTGLTDKNEKLIFVGDVVEFVGGCRDFLDLSGVKSPLYTVNKGDKMIVRKLKSGYTLSLPWIDCDAPNRIGNLGNYDFWNLRRDFIVIEAQEPPMLNLELAKDIRESLAARKIGGTGYQLSSEENDLVYEILNDYIARNDEANVDVKLPFDVSLGANQ